MAQDRKGEDTYGTCAGAPIKDAMHPYSDDLIKGCEKFAQMAFEATEQEDIRLYNSSCIFFSVSCIEAKLNEWLSILKKIETSKSKFLTEMEKLQKTLKLERKWNLIASTHNGVMWSSGEDPFQSFETLVSLRNELVHYKGTFLGKDETPNNRIKGLMETFNIKSNSTFIENDCSSWIYDLLNSNKLGGWVYEKTKPFYNDLPTLLTKS